MLELHPMRICFLLPAICLCATECAAPPTALDLISDSLLTTVVHKRAAAGLKRASDGASTLSREWVEGRRQQWYIENQRGGCDFVEAGVVLDDPALVDKGLQIFEWGLARQNANDGSFPESGDPFHSVSIFVIDAGRSLIAIREKAARFKALM